jgi:hypothetical protein
MLNMNRNMHLFLLSILPVLARGATWMLGAPGQTCFAACASSSPALGNCNLNELSTLSNYPSAWGVVGVTCIPKPGTKANTLGTPYVHTDSANNGSCHYPTTAGSVADCFIDPTDNGHRRLCPCGSNTPDCSNTNGQTRTTKTCKCGTATCSSTEACLVASPVGQTTSNCLTEPLCANVNGATINSGTCQCLTNECTTSTGLYCKITLAKFMPYVPATSI